MKIMWPNLEISLDTQQSFDGRLEAWNFIKLIHIHTVFSMKNTFTNLFAQYSQRLNV